MIVIICIKYKKNQSRTVDATEQTGFSKSRLNDLEDIGQGQGSSNATHPLMLLVICTKYGKNPSWTVDATGQTRKVNGQTDKRTDRVNPIYPSPQTFLNYTVLSLLTHIKTWKHMGVLSTMFLLMPCCWSTRPSVSTVLTKYQLCIDPTHKSHNASDKYPTMLFEIRDKSSVFSPSITLKFDWLSWKTRRHLFYVNLSFVHHFKTIEFKLELQSGNAQFGSKLVIFFCPVWPWNLTDDLEKQQGTSSMLLQALCIISKPSVNSELQSGNPQFESKLTIFFCPVWP